MLHPPDHYIETRTEFIKESQRHLVMFGDHEFLPEQIEADIREAEAEIRYAEHRISAGTTYPNTMDRAQSRLERN